MQLHANSIDANAANSASIVTIQRHIAAIQRQHNAELNTALKHHRFNTASWQVLLDLAAASQLRQQYHLTQATSDGSSAIWHVRSQANTPTVLRDWMRQQQYIQESQIDSMQDSQFLLSFR